MFADGGAPPRAGDHRQTSSSSDGLAYVAEGGVQLPGGGPEALAAVPAGQDEAVIESAEECPGECIFIEVL
ncbi:MAG: ferredoxin [Acidimicrobiales bacterium]|nr:ferredoxin [Acidimicrobiales bacterium]